MSFKIGFASESYNKNAAETIRREPQRTIAPRKSLVQVYFPDRNTTLTYFNDRFDLYCGDLVYVDGKLTGLIGRITDVNYNFKIKISDYKRVIALVDTTVHGQFFMAGSHFVTFDRNALPSNKIITWFKSPEAEEEFVSGNDDTSFRLDDLSGMNISKSIAERGHKYYMENKVRYISVDNGKGYAIVEGNDCYEIEFRYHNGEISQLVCSCFCSYSCKHEFASMLQLRETLEIIGKNYADEYEHSGYFAAVNKGTLFAFAIDGKDNASFTL
ncbi:MAG: hypothetical protein II237_05080 [Clostridia bacterium]|nr:hypothetical protein [Clostridia bacterium]